MQLGTESLIPANLETRVYLLKVIPSPSTPCGSVPSDTSRKETYLELDGRGHAGNFAAGPAQVGMRTPSCVGAARSPCSSGCLPHAANTCSAQLRGHAATASLSAVGTNRADTEQTQVISTNPQGTHLWNGSRGPDRTRTIMERIKP